jgi:hypothetical protein
MTLPRSGTNAFGSFLEKNKKLNDALIGYPHKIQVPRPRIDNATFLKNGRSSQTYRNGKTLFYTRNPGNFRPERCFPRVGGLLGGTPPDPQGRLRRGFGVMHKGAVWCIKWMAARLSAKRTQGVWGRAPRKMPYPAFYPAFWPIVPRRCKCP